MGCVGWAHVFARPDESVLDNPANENEQRNLIPKVEIGGPALSAHFEVRVFVSGFHGFGFAGALGFTPKSQT